ncbi:MAG: hypothetical protein KA797_02230 [Chitinophagales bacterium]|nr:hypothetical protein [Chitinophagales bacterium]
MTIRLKAYFSFILLTTILSCEEYRIPADGQIISGGYIFRYEGAGYLMANNHFKPSIYGDIKACSFNDDFILIKQKPHKENYIIYTAEELMSYATSLKRDSLECELDQFMFYKSFINQNQDLVKTIFNNLSPNHDENDINKSLLLADNLIKYDAFYKSIFKNKINYWIISHKEINKNDYMPKSKILGPFTKEEYVLKRKEIGVPSSLELKEE